eukprot:tig00020629_g12456.t1
MGDAVSKPSEADEDSKLAQQLQDEELARSLQAEESAAAFQEFAAVRGPPRPPAGSSEKLPHESDEEYAARLQALEVAAAELEADMMAAQEQQGYGYVGQPYGGAHVGAGGYEPAAPAAAYARGPAPARRVPVAERAALVEGEGDLPAEWGGAEQPPAALLVLDCEPEEARDAFLRRARTVRSGGGRGGGPFTSFLLSQVLRQAGPEPLACADLHPGLELGRWLLPAARAYPSSAFYAVDPLYAPPPSTSTRRCRTLSIPPPFPYPPELRPPPPPPPLLLQTERTGIFSSRTHALLLTAAGAGAAPPGPEELAALELEPGRAPEGLQLRDFELASSTPSPRRAFNPPPPTGVLFPYGEERPPNVRLVPEDFRRTPRSLPPGLHVVAATERAVPPGARAVPPAASWRGLASLLRAGGAAVRTHAPGAGDDPLGVFAQTARVPDSPCLVAWLPR